MTRLQLAKTGAGSDEQNCPGQARPDSEVRVKQFRAAKKEQHAGQEIGSSAEREVTEAGDNRAERADKVLRGFIWRREITPWNP